MTINLRKAIDAFLNRLCPSRGQGGSQETDMRSFVLRDLDKVVVEHLVKACSCELGLGEVCKAATVEIVFKVLEDEGICQNGDIVLAD